jgi:hypothetical protein
MQRKAKDRRLRQKLEEKRRRVLDKVRSGGQVVCCCGCVCVCA